MSKLVAVLAVLMILTGAVLLAIPRPVSAPVGERGLPSAQQVMNVYQVARGYAEQVNAPLSILFGIVSLFYQRRRYKAEVSGR